MFKAEGRKYTRRVLGIVAVIALMFARVPRSSDNIQSTLVDYILAIYLVDMLLSEFVV